MADTHRLELAVLLAAVCLMACGSSPQTSATQRIAARIVPNGLSASLPPATTPYTYSLDRISGAHIPLTQPAIVPLSEDIIASGFAIDQIKKQLAGGVDVVIDGLPFIAHYQTDRMDVADYFKDPVYGKAGFTLSLAASLFGPGKHQLAVRVIGSDKKSYSESAAIPFEIK